IEATRAGEPGFNHLLPNEISVAYRTQLQDFYTHYQNALKNYDRAQLNAEGQISYDVLAWECQVNLDGLSFPTHLLPLNQFYSLNLTIGQLAGGTSAQPFKTVRDYKDWLNRLDLFVAWCDTALVNMKKGVEAGYVLPKALTVKVIPQFEALSKGPVEDHLFYSPVGMMPEDFSEADRESLTNSYNKMVIERLIPTFSAITNYLQTDYLAASRASSGISDLPGGRAYYDTQIRKYTTTTMTADEIFDLGENEVARIEGEMKKVMAEVGFEGELKDFFGHLRTKPELLPFDEPQQVIDNFNAIHEKMKPNLEKLFDLVPKAPFEVRRTEAFREASSSAEYNPGSTDGTRPGIFYVPIPDVKKYSTLSDEDLFLHEAIPGHHYQISLAQENEALPDFRRTLWYSAYGEGWALYSESLGKELGLYTDPYQYFGMLSAEMHRAIRLVVDVGMHVKGWTREQAIEYSLAHEAESESSVIAEIERYMSWPGQALSYKVGQLKIRELRAKAEKAKGEAFDVKAFHRQ
ncbi:MAG: DUF885 domain-containing protein, partial [Bacteroidota bacterium]